MGHAQKARRPIFILSGELELVLYDDRDGSSTRGMVSKLYMSEFSRRLINIPAGIWHANRNVETMTGPIRTVPSAAE